MARAFPSTSLEPAVDDEEEEVEASLLRLLPPVLILEGLMCVYCNQIIVSDMILCNY